MTAQIIGPFTESIEFILESKKNGSPPEVKIPFKMALPRAPGRDEGEELDAGDGGGAQDHRLTAGEGLTRGCSDVVNPARIFSPRFEMFGWVR